MLFFCRTNGKIETFLVVNHVAVGQRRWTLELLNYRNTSSWLESSHWSVTGVASTWWEGRRWVLLQWGLELTVSSPPLQPSIHCSWNSRVQRVGVVESLSSHSLRGCMFIVALLFHPQSGPWGPVETRPAASQRDAAHGWWIVMMMMLLKTLQLVLAWFICRQTFWKWSFYWL